jgi:hypothetical protein
MKEFVDGYEDPRLKHPLYLHLTFTDLLHRTKMNRKTLAARLKRLLEYGKLITYSSGKSGLARNNFKFYRVNPGRYRQNERRFYHYLAKYKRLGKTVKTYYITSRVTVRIKLLPALTQLSKE